MAEICKLMTSDGQLVEVKKEIAEYSRFVKNIIEDTGIDEDVPLPGVTKATLETVLVYLEYVHAESEPEIPKPLRSNNLGDVIHEWFVSYLEKD